MANTDASASLLGYLFQIELGLTLMLEMGPEHPTAQLKIEIFDDISFDDESAPFTLAQAKLHMGQSRSLTDNSVDLWKTLGIWVEQGLWDARHLLLTTERAADGSAAASLRVERRDVTLALELLDAAAQTSTNRESAPQRASWASLEKSNKLRLLQNVYVLDQGDDLDGVRARADRLLRMAAPAHGFEAYVDEVRGSWYRTVIAILQRHRTGITFLQFQNAASDIRDRFTTTALITTVLPPTGSLADGILADHSDYMFVEQLKWIDAPLSQIGIAIIDYYRATEQRAHWVENSYLDFLEVEQFKQQLVTEWRMLFDWAVVQATGAAQDPITVGQSLFQRVMLEVRVRIRDNYDEAFLRRGTYHEIANVGLVGWHPEFETRVRGLLGVTP